MRRNFYLTAVIAFLSFTAIAQKKVLFVMGASKELQLKNGKTYKETGVFLSEFYLAYKDIIQLGYDVDFATS